VCGCAWAQENPYPVVWNECAAIGVRAIQSKAPTALYVWHDGLSPQYNWPHISIPRDEWVTVDLADTVKLDWDPKLPVDTKAVFLLGQLVTSGWPNVYCSQIGEFRAPGSILQLRNYQFAAVGSVPGGAYRHQVSTWVPVVGRKFEFSWYYSNVECPMVMSWELQAYCR
jgi:hypothetical protein